MTTIASLLDEVMDQADQKVTTSGMRTWGEQVHECDGCGVANDEVDLWATDSGSGDEVWLCLSCGDW